LSRGLRCVGSGDNFSDDIPASEVLPKDWSTIRNDGGYCFKYRHVEKTAEKFILKISRDSDVINIVLLRMSDEVTKLMTKDITKEVTDDTPHHMINEEAFIKHVFKELLDDFLPKIPKIASAQSVIFPFFVH
jgi:hypothetical protein